MKVERRVCPLGACQLQGYKRDLLQVFRGYQNEDTYSPKLNPFFYVFKTGWMPEAVKRCEYQIYLSILVRNTRCLSSEN